MIVGQLPSAGTREHFGIVVPEGQHARALRQPGPQRALGERHDQGAPGAWLAKARRARSSGSAAERRPRLADPRGSDDARRRQARGVADRGRQHARLLRASIALVVVNSAGWDDVKAGVLRLGTLPRVVPGDPRGVPHQREDLPGRGGRSSSSSRSLHRGAAETSGTGVLPDSRARDRLRGPLSRRPDDPRHLHPRLRRACAPAAGRPDLGALLGQVALVLVYSAYVSEVYRAGIESVHPSQDAAARSLGPHARARRCATSSSRRPSAA